MPPARPRPTQPYFCTKAHELLQLSVTFSLSCVFFFLSVFTMLDCDQQRILRADALFSDRDLLEVGRTRNEGTARGEWGPGLGKEIDEFFYL